MCGGGGKSWCVAADLCCEPVNAVYPAPPQCCAPPHPTPPHPTTPPHTITPPPPLSTPPHHTPPHRQQPARPAGACQGPGAAPPTLTHPHTPSHKHPPLLSTPPPPPTGSNLPALLARAKALVLPKNPLDDLIERLGGPDAVAEMTGRAKRMEAQPRGGYSYVSRSAQYGRCSLDDVSTCAGGLYCWRAGWVVCVCCLPHGPSLPHTLSLECMHEMWCWCCR